MIKQTGSVLRVTAMFLSILVTANLGAQQAATLSQSQWTKKIGACALDHNVLRETMAQIPSEDKVAFTRRVVKAATRLPVSPEEKGSSLVKTSVACIASATADVKKEVIAEVFAGVPIEYLPVVTEELAKRFNQDYNGLPNDQYRKIAEDTLDVAMKRNASTDVPSVRNTFVILAFLSGAKDPALKDVLIAKLPDERMRNLAASWIPPALNSKNYDAMLAAADVRSIPNRTNVQHGLVGHSNLDRLLSDILLNQEAVTGEQTETGEEVVNPVWVTLSQIRAAAGITAEAPTAGQLNHAPDYGINRLPTLVDAGGGAGDKVVIYACTPCGPIPIGYQNQGTTVRGSNQR